MLVRHGIEVVGCVGSAMYVDCLICISIRKAGVELTFTVGAANRDNPVLGNHRSTTQYVLMKH